MHAQSFWKSWEHHPKIHQRNVRYVWVLQVGTEKLVCDPLTTSHLWNQAVLTVCIDQRKHCAKGENKTRSYEVSLDVEILLRVSPILFLSLHAERCTHSSHKKHNSVCEILPMIPWTQKYPELGASSWCPAQLTPIGKIRNANNLTKHNVHKTSLYFIVKQRCLRYCKQIC